MREGPLSERPIRSLRDDALFVSANGIGQGHLTRQLAVARRLPPGVTAAFLTMSYSTSIARDLGFAAHFVPHHHLSDEEPAVWNARLAEEIELLLDARASRTLVYDVNFVFDGVIDVLRRRRNLRSVWIRRAMWPQHHAAYLGAGVHFSAIVEPGEFAESYDTGPTVLARERVTAVPPVLLLNPGECMGREEARAALGLPQEATVVLLDIARASSPALSERHGQIDALLAARGVHAVELNSALAATAERTSHRPGHSRLTLYPAYRFARAFDAMIVRASYNTFHENIAGAIPTLFVPDEAADMDRQVDRARFAADNGLALLCRLDAPEDEVRTAVETLLDADARARLSQACEAFLAARGGWRNGADDIATMIMPPSVQAAYRE